MGSFESDLHHHRLLSEMSDPELEEYVEGLRAERKRLADLHVRDRGMLAMGGDEGRPHGKLRPRLVATKAKWKDYGTRLVAAESELARRRSRRRIDWDEPTDTDMDRLSNRLRAS
jgi:hypothetical protein